MLFPSLLVHCITSPVMEFFKNPLLGHVLAEATLTVTEPEPL